MVQAGTWAALLGVALTGASGIISVVVLAFKIGSWKHQMEEQNDDIRSDIQQEHKEQKQAHKQVHRDVEVIAQELNGDEDVGMVENCPVCGGDPGVGTHDHG